MTRFRAGTLIAALLGGLSIFLFIQPGIPPDEAEHLHAAWLMVQGLRPIHDFFEHHTPLLWYVLGFLFRLGVRGPESLYFARLLVLFCAGIWVLALFVLARRWSPASGPRQWGFSLAAFGAIAVFAREILVARPETLAVAFVGTALLCWTHRSRSLAAAAGSGVAFALACLASPRFVILAPVFAIADSDGKPALPVPWRRLAAAVTGAIATTAVFLTWLCPWHELVFDVRFSSLLQHVGLMPSIDLLNISASLAVGILIAGLLLATSAPPRRTLAWWCVHGVMVWAACVASGGKYPNSQAYAPALIWLCLFAAWLEAQPIREQMTEARSSMLFSTLASVLAAILVQTIAASANRYSVAPLTASRRLLLDSLPADARVFLLPTLHPITINDASYWGSLLLEDSPGKMCEAAQEYGRAYPQAAVQLPPCDFIGDLRRAQPSAVVRLLPVLGPPDQYNEIEAELSAHYQSNEALDEAPTRSFPGNVLFRKR